MVGRGLSWGLEKVSSLKRSVEVVKSMLVSLVVRLSWHVHDDCTVHRMDGLVKHSSSRDSNSLVQHGRVVNSENVKG
jgi:hypothetical protein